MLGFWAHWGLIKRSLKNYDNFCGMCFFWQKTIFNFKRMIAAYNAHRSNLRKNTVSKSLKKNRFLLKFLRLKPDIVHFFLYTLKILSWLVLPKYQWWELYIQNISFLHEMRWSRSSEMVIMLICVLYDIEI